MDGLDRFIRQITTGIEGRFGAWIAPVEEGVNYFPGTTIRVLGISASRLTSGLDIVGSVGRPEHPGIGVYLTLGEYIHLPGLDVSLEGLRNLALEISKSAPRKSMLFALARIGSALETPGGEQALVDEYSRLLKPEIVNRLNEALNRADPPRRFLVRQVVSQAFGLAMKNGPIVDEAYPAPEVFRPIVLCHALAGSFGVDDGGSGQLVVGEPSGDALVLSLLANLQFNARTNDLTAIARSRKLWRMKSERGEAVLSPLVHHDILAKALSTNIELLLAAVLAVYPYSNSSRERSPVIEPKLSHPRLGSELSRIVNRLSVNWDDNCSDLRDPSSEWDFNYLLDRPLVRVNDTQYLLVDSAILMYRMTDGIFQDVVNQLVRGKESSKFRTAWGHVIEDYVISRLSEIELGRDFRVYLESDHSAAYPGKNTSRPDLVIDYGESVLVIEVVSHLLSHQTIAGQDVKDFRDNFISHLDQKLSQLDNSIRPMRFHPLDLFGVAVFKNFVPVIVTGDGMSQSVVLEALIRQRSEVGSLFQFGMCPLPLVIDLDEVEMLEGLAGHGEFIPELINSWRDSDFRGLPLKNYLIDRFNKSPEKLRAESLQREFDLLTNELLRLVGEEDYGTGVVE